MTYFRKSYEPPLIFLKLKKLFFYIIFLKKNYFCTNPEMLFTIFPKKEAREREKKRFFPLSEENNPEIYWHHVRIYILVHFLCITVVMSRIPENWVFLKPKPCFLINGFFVWSLFKTFQILLYLFDKNWNWNCISYFIKN